MPNEQVSAKPKPLQGLCQLVRNHGPMAMKDGRNEECHGYTACGKTGATTAFAKTQKEGKMATRIPPHHSGKEIKVIVRQVHLGYLAHVKGLKSALTALGDPA